MQIDHQDFDVRISRYAYIPVCGVLVALAVIIAIVSTVKSDVDGFEVSAILSGISLLYFVVIYNNKISIRGGIFIYRPFLGKRWVKDLNFLTIDVFGDGFGEGRGWVSAIEISDNGKKPRKSYIVCRLYRQADVVQFLKLADIDGAKINRKK